MTGLLSPGLGVAPAVGPGPLFDPVVLAAVGLLVAGVIGSLLPLVPGPLVSLAGVYLYWWHTGYAEPGALALAALTAVGLAAFLLDTLAGALSARVGGASTRTMALAGVAGIALLFVAGPLGILVGIAGTVFFSEYLNTGDPGRSARAAAYATLGALGANLVQAAVAFAMLVAVLALIL